MAASEMQTELISVNLSDEIIAQVAVVETGQEKVKLWILLLDIEED